MRINNTVIVANGLVSSKKLLEQNKNSFFVGIDRGALHLINNHLSLHLALGDFDSVSKRELQKIKKKAQEIITFKKEKDYTDTELGLNEVIKKGYKNITLLGVTGTRLDHSLANILLLERYEKKDRQIKIVDQNNEISLLKPGKTKIEVRQYQYISFISLSNFSTLSLNGFKYPLINKKIKRGQTLCLSNELIKREGIIEVKKGRILLIRSKD